MSYCTSSKIFFGFLVLSLNLLNGAQSSKILVVFPMPSPSHSFLGNGLVRGLLQAGHEVTHITSFSQEKFLNEYKSTYHEVFMEGLLEEQTKKRGNMFEMHNMNMALMLPFMVRMMENFMEAGMSHPNVQALLKSDAQFDVVVLEEFLTTGFKMFAHHYNCPLVLFSSTGPNAWINDLVGNPAPPSYVPDFLLTYSDKMSFMERFLNSLMYIYQRLVFKFYALPKHKALAQKYFPDTYQNLDRIHYNCSVALLNSHPSVNVPVPTVPNAIHIGGFHIEPPKALPKDLQDYLDNAKEGVIYFSMGSNLKSAQLPEEKKQIILRVFGKLKLKVLWKFETQLEGLPPNVMIQKWVPQQDVLAHKNVKLFISHGGLLSTTESIYNGVPMLAIPVFGDQFLNAKNIINSGFGLSIPYTELNEDDLLQTLNELIINPSYGENAKMRSKIFHDRPSKPLDTAVYWIEYAIRHKGAPHLRVAGVDLPFYKYLLLDVIFFAIALSLIPLFLTCKVLKFVKNKLCNKTCTKKQSKKKNVKKDQ